MVKVYAELVAKALFKNICLQLYMVQGNEETESVYVYIMYAQIIKTKKNAFLPYLDLMCTYVKKIWLKHYIISLFAGNMDILSHMMVEADYY